MPTVVGVINAGSSSVKFSVFHGDQAILTAQIDGIGTRATARATGADGQPIDAPPVGPGALNSLTDVPPILLPWAFENLGGHTISALGHRVVHGGTHFTGPARVTAKLLTELEALVPLAPLHEPQSLALMQTALQLHPDLPQVACFDTAFHQTMPEINAIFALPYAYFQQGVRRYGFHGLSYEYIASVLPEHAPEIASGRVVVAHLGNGCSACAISNGRSVATTMGFTALDGLPMGTRCGALDPGIILYLLQQKRLSADELSELLYRQSGVLGLSGVSSDFRELIACETDRARLAVTYFCQQTARHIASLATTMGGLDGIVFTAGVGENSAPVRALICQFCAWLGVEIDASANNRHASRISATSSRVAVYVIKTDENRMIAHHVRSVIQQTGVST